MTERIIIDTDGGIDDALALLLAFHSPELDILAVTTVFGNIPVNKATENVIKMFFLCNSEGKLRIAQGKNRPKKGKPFFAFDIHGADGLGDIDWEKEFGKDIFYQKGKNTELSKLSADEEIRYWLKVSQDPVTIITLGPLTNLAAAIESEFKVMSRVKQIIMMGGAYTVPGNITPVAEFNIHSDPYAAETVFSSGLPIKAVGLDVTRKVLLTRPMLDKFITYRNTNMGLFIRKCTDKLFSRMEELKGNLEITLHDPLALGVAIDPSWVITEPKYVEVETTGQKTFGMTVADNRSLRPKWKKRPNLEVSLQVRTKEFWDFFWNRIEGREKSLV